MLMKRKDVVQFTGLCYTTVYNLEKKGLFPPRKHLSPGRVAWLRSEVEQWIADKCIPVLLLILELSDGKINPMLHVVS